MCDRSSSVQALADPIVGAGDEYPIVGSSEIGSQGNIVEPGEAREGPLYSIGTWDVDEQAFSPQQDVPAFNLTLWQLKESMRLLRAWGYSCHRYRDDDGGHSDNDVWVLIERTDGKPESEILQGWKR